MLRSFEDTQVFIEKIPKYVQIADSILAMIRKGEFDQSELLPSINELSSSFCLSRETIEKAYNELRYRGIVMSVRGKGYYITRIDLTSTIRVLCIFNKLSFYKEKIYNGLLQQLGENATVDLRLHHHNVETLKLLLDANIGLYDYYAIIPHFKYEQEKAIEVLKRVPREKLIILDRNLPQLTGNCITVFQDFERDIMDALLKAYQPLSKYSKLYLVFPDSVYYPPEIIKGFHYFCLFKNFKYEIINNIDLPMPLEDRSAYIVINEDDLVNLIKNCRSQKKKIGRDVGIISYNESALKELLQEGITVMSTDHYMMGQTAAKFLFEKKPVKIKNAFTIDIRASL